MKSPPRDSFFQLSQNFGLETETVISFKSCINMYKIYPFRQIINIKMSIIQPQIQQSILQKYESQFGCSYSKIKQFSDQLFSRQKDIIGSIQKGQIRSGELKIGDIECLLQWNQKIKQLKQVFTEFRQQCMSGWFVINQQILAIFKQIVTVYQSKIQSLQLLLLEQQKSSRQHSIQLSQTLQCQFTQDRKQQQAQHIQMVQTYNFSQNNISYHKNKISGETVKQQNTVQYDAKITELFSQEITDLFSPSSSICQKQTVSELKRKIDILAQKQKIRSMKQNQCQIKSKADKNTCINCLKSSINASKNDRCNETFQEDDNMFEYVKQKNKVQKPKTSILGILKKNSNRQVYEYTVPCRFNQLRRHLYPRKTNNQ